MLPLDQYHANTSSKAGLSVKCKGCRATEKRGKRKERKQECVAYKGGACGHCGGVFHSAVYDFHHIDPSKKDFKISAFRSGKFEKLRAELDKCLLLCANCHRMEHARLDEERLYE